MISSLKTKRLNTNHLAVAAQALKQVMLKATKSHLHLSSIINIRIRWTRVYTPKSRRTWPNLRSWFLRPSFLSNRHFLPGRCSASVLLCSPSPVLTQPELCIRSIIKIDLGYLSLNQGPDSPVESWDASKDVDLSEQSTNFSFLFFWRLVYT